MNRFLIFLVATSSVALAQQNMGRSADASEFELTNRLEPIPVSSDTSSEAALKKKAEEEKEEQAFIDSVLGEGTQSRILDSVSNWVTDKAKANPGCVERFVCETYRTGENMSGFPYFVMSLTNAAVSFMVAEMFDQSIDITEITRAARYGRQIGSCHTMDCDFLDGQIRSVGEYLGSFEEFLSSIFETVSNSINIG